MSEPTTAPDAWQRLDPRMMLVLPIREVMRFLPALIGLAVAGTASGGVPLHWQVLGIAVPVGLGLARYLTTSFRVTAERVELRRGLLERHVLSTRRDRVRTVDLTASPVHRVLGLTTVRIGTGTASTNEEDSVDLDALPVEQARALRTHLLDGLRAGALPDGPGGLPGAPPAPPLLELDPAWSRYAPLTSAGLGLAGVAIGLGSQVLENLAGRGRGLSVPDPQELGGLVAVGPLLVGVVVLVTGLAVAGYLVSNWGFTLTHPDGSWHLSRGLLTTRETSLDEDRVAGVVLGEPLGLRLAGAARLSAIVTGLGDAREHSSVLVPPAPRPVVDRVAAVVVGLAGPVVGALEPHGPAAVRRRWARALVPGLVAGLVVALGADGPAGVLGWPLVLGLLAPLAAAGLAADRARSLGHALVDGHLVARSGSLLCRREVLATDDVIGWTFRSTWPQRRAGLTTLVATTAGGPQAVTVLDVPEDRAIRVAGAAVPGLVDQFRA